MARTTPGRNTAVSAERRTLPDPFYYLGNFQSVIDCLDGRYRRLLSSEEQQFILRFRELPRASRALLVRMVMRQGIFFRRSRLEYAEIGDTSAAAAPLLELGWVGETTAPAVDDLQHLLTKTELLQYFSLSSTHQRFKKDDLIAILRVQHPKPRPFSAWCKPSTDCIYELIVAPLCERFRLMFFGNFRQGWSEFVLADLGIFSYEKVPASHHSPAFGTRAHIDAFEQLYRCRQQLDAGLPLEAVEAGIPPPIEQCDWLEDRRQKLLFQVGRAYEQCGDGKSALAVLSSCTHRGARIRTIRLLQRAHEWEPARHLCFIARLHPENDAEGQQARRLLPGLNKKLGVADDLPLESVAVPAFEMILDAPSSGYAVEYAVRDRLLQESAAHTTIHYVENGLINSLFGLLCWKAIFAPIAGAFFHDFQYGPADLSSDHFYRRRESAFAECLAQLSTEQYRTSITRCFAEKYGIQCPFVSWGLLNERLLQSAFACFPAAHLRLWFEWIVRDTRDNRAGFPDLVQFWPAQRLYRMIEVKAPGDRLQDNQRRFLEFCLLHRMPVSLCHVRWSRS
jgi:VRR-NUC domain/Fanconi anemia-associated nuclease SAP domain